MRLAVFSAAFLCGGCGWLGSDVPSDHPSGPELARVLPVAEAVSLVWDADPLVVGLGEWHARAGHEVTDTTLARVTELLLPSLEGRVSDVVFETWRVVEACHASSVALAETVAEETRRPPETTSDVVRAAVKARDLGMTPHTLGLSCEEHDEVYLEDRVDYGRLLLLLTDKLATWGEKVRETPSARVLLYGGAVHNDLFPDADMAEYSYGPRLHGALSGRYVAIDLIIPSIARGYPALEDEPWWPEVGRELPAGHVMVIEESPGSWIWVLSDGASSASGS